MLNTNAEKLATRALADQTWSRAARRDHLYPLIPAVSNALFWHLHFTVFRLSEIPTMELSLLTTRKPNSYRPSLVATYNPSNAPELLSTSV